MRGRAGPRLRWRKRSCEFAQPGVGELFRQRTLTDRELGYRLWAVYDDITEGQWPKEREAVDVGEAERAADLDVLVAGAGQHGADVTDLALQPVDQARTVARVDEQDRPPRDEQA